MLRDGQKAPLYLLLFLSSMTIRQYLGGGGALMKYYEKYYEIGAGLNEASQSSRAGDEGEYSSPSQCQPLCYMFMFCFEQACVVFCAVFYC